MLTTSKNYQRLSSVPRLIITYNLSDSDGRVQCVLPGMSRKRWERGSVAVTRACTENTVAIILVITPAVDFNNYNHRRRRRRRAINGPPTTGDRRPVNAHAYDVARLSIITVSPRQTRTHRRRADCRSAEPGPIGYCGAMCWMTPSVRAVTDTDNIRVLRIRRKKKTGIFRTKTVRKAVQNTAPGPARFRPTDDDTRRLPRDGRDWFTHTSYGITLQYVWCYRARATGESYCNSLVGVDTGSRRVLVWAPREVGIPTRTQSPPCYPATDIMKSPTRRNAVQRAVVRIGLGPITPKQ